MVSLHGGEASEARELLKEMQEEGVRLGAEVYHEVLAVCANGTQWREAREVLQEMGEQRHGPDHRAYHLVMDSKGLGGRHEAWSSYVSDGKMAGGAPENFSEELFVEATWRSYSACHVMLLEVSSEQATD